MDNQPVLPRSFGMDESETAVAERILDPAEGPRHCELQMNQAQKPLVIRCFAPGLLGERDHPLKIAVHPSETPEHSGAPDPLRKLFLQGLKNSRASFDRTSAEMGVGSF